MSATTDPTTKKIKAVVALNRMGDGNITPLLDAALKGLQGHSDLFPRPPVDLATFEAAMNSYKASIPAAIDGKRHELRVELTKEAKAKHKGVRLKYRPEYIPVREEPDWTH